MKTRSCAFRWLLLAWVAIQSPVRGDDEVVLQMTEPYAEETSASVMETTQAAVAVVPGSDFDQHFFFALQSYRFDMQYRVAHAWNHYLRHYREFAERGKVSFRFYVNDSGRISLVEPLEGDPDALLGVLAQRAILHINDDPRALPDVVTEKLPRGFFDVVSLRVR